MSNKEKSGSSRGRGASCAATCTVPWMLHHLASRASPAQGASHTATARCALLQLDKKHGRSHKLSLAYSMVVITKCILLPQQQLTQEEKRRGNVKDMAPDKNRKSKTRREINVAIRKLWIRKISFSNLGEAKRVRPKEEWNLSI
ncbi:hypothetical protein PsorP6_006071 [Peronosclerospora sorghi]|uniref:Uncharacterized protein n=1 Tax=Peronosclerospora sorghi TaxID=230839 RepID=A0ACC0W2U7_9STRA|nr:hypothetical protein PsorP6_006071 [Peronosclerospora sorghi]